MCVFVAGKASKGGGGGGVKLYDRGQPKTPHEELS